ncbi:MAG: hypothetical protein Q8Q00_14205 [Dehalococcoidia bacterium]|nr:hypothetical protein [Dehalococcoidia bacterium]
MESPRGKPSWIPPDEEFKAMLARRLERLETGIGEVTTEIDRLNRELAAADREREYLRSLLAIWEPDQWEHLSGEVFVNRTNGAKGTSAAVIAAQDAAEMVVRLLEEVHQPLHFREIEKELRARNWYVAGGADPANTLLAKYFDDARLYRPARGIYALRPEGETVRSVGSKRKTRRNRGSR